MLTLRLSDERTRQLLRTVAEHRGVSMNAVAEEAIGEHLRQEAAVIEEELARALEVVRTYRFEERLGADADALATAEVSEPDPLAAVGGGVDALDFAGQFVRTLER